MTDYTSEIEKLNLEAIELRNQKESIKVKLCQIDDEIEKLEKLRIESLPNELTEDEEKWIRDELTLVGNLLSGENIAFGGVKLLDEEPDEMDTRGYFGRDHSNKFSIKIELEICTEWRACFRCNVTIKTKLPRIEAIVREMYKTTEDEYETDNLQERLTRRRWNIDWDYHYRLKLENPYVHKDD